ncbi:MAG TPA: thioredoxin family protein [candidate division Zixibacteria bacterium]|nr:TM0996/MTH895 family glutaredoxin-like protein [candidate division Zixibacteria bacterium]MDD4917545.1 thioredoxin family protein [candidate division Zixibacteria bacterium]MDM7972186.1 thioredoxin family protein [candidate division Zixibacteria bacterium]HOD66482.1 thioredoxin family protein [candidate division Zixibacteria bacterium]HOZ06975.1 thioredoxin family protein [candidate division Zixibacteria bacterium]
MKKIQVFGPGCAKCEELARLAAAAVAELGLACEVEKVSDIRAIMEAGVMITPALAVDGRVLVAGKVPSLAKLKEILA